MNKKVRFLIVAIMLVIITLITYRINASEKIKVVDYMNSSSSAVLYENGDLLLWNETGSYKLENVKSFKNILNHILIHYNDGKVTSFWTYDNESVLFENVKELDEYYYVTNDDSLYAYSGYIYSQGPSFVDISNGSNTFKIFDNIKSYKRCSDYNSVLILDKNNSLYIYGENIFGIKINNGEPILDSPIKIADNVKEYNTNFYLTMDNELFFINETISEPVKVADNIDKVYTGDIISYVNNIPNDMVITSNGESYLLIPIIDANSATVSFEKKYITNKKIKDIMIYITASVNSNYELIYLTEDNELYKAVYTDRNDIKLTELKNIYVDNHVKEIKKFDFSYIGSIYYLKDNGDVFTFYYYDSLLTAIHHGILSEEGLDKYRLFGGVKKLFSQGFLMNDETIWSINNDNYNYYSLNYGAGKSNITINVPSVVKGIYNVPEVISPKEVILFNSSKSKFTVGDKFDYYAMILPYNADSKDVKWSSSNEKVVTVNEKGLIEAVGVGKATIKVSVSGYDIEDSVEVMVYPKQNGIEIEGDKKINLEVYEKRLLKANVLPEDALDREVEWSVIGDDSNVHFDNYCYDYDIFECKDKFEVNTRLPSNYIIVSVSAGGNYTIVASTKDKKYSASIDINTVEKVNYIDINIDNEHYDGTFNAFIYLNEDNTLKVNTKIYPETATDKTLTWSSADPSIVSVSKDGILTGHKKGRTQITIKSIDGNATKMFNVIVYDENKGIIGDVNGDGEVNILDVIKLRKYLAGLEALE